MLFITDTHANFSSDKFSKFLSTTIFSVHNVADLDDCNIRRQIIKQAGIDHFVIDIGNNKTLQQADVKRYIGYIGKFTKFLHERSNATITLVVPITDNYHNQKNILANFINLRNSSEKEMLIVDNESLYSKYDLELKVKFRNNPQRVSAIRLENIKLKLKGS